MENGLAIPGKRKYQALPNYVPESKSLSYHFIIVSGRLTISLPQNSRQEAPLGQRNWKDE